MLLVLPLTEAIAEQQKPLTLASAIKLSLSKNPNLAIYQIRELALSGQQQIVGLRPVYELGVEAENFLGDGNRSNFEGAEITVSLSSVIELGGKRNARLKLASNNIDLLHAQRQVEALELLGEVTRRYIDILAAQERVILAEEATLLADATLFEVNKRARAGAIPEAEVKRAQAAAAQTRLTVSSEQQQLQYFKVALAALWGQQDPGFSTVTGSLYQVKTDIEFKKLYKRVIQNPAIQIFATEQRLKQAAIQLARTQASSNIRWSIGVRQFQQSNDTALTAGFSLPLFSGSRSAGLISRAQAENNEVIAKKDIALLSLHTQLFHAYSNRQQAKYTLLELQNNIIPALEQALTETKNAYQRGRYSYLDFLTARQELITARRTLIDAASAALRYGANIEQLTSESLAAIHYNSAIDISGVSK